MSLGNQLLRLTRIDRTLEHMIGSVRITRGLQNLLGRVRGASPAPLPVRTGPNGELDQEIRLPVAGIYVRWDLEGPVATLEWDLNVLADPTTSVGIYLALAQGRIDGSTFYLGLQTDIWDPGRVRGAGKGLIFSTWWTFDASATRLAPGGFRELGTHEGRFVGVRRPYPWVVGDYRVTLLRAEPAAQRRVPTDWFDLYIQPMAPRDTGWGRPELVGDQTWIGGLAFPRRHASIPAMIEEVSTAFMEVYSGVRRWGDIPLGCRSHGLRRREVLPGGTTEYPVFPFGNDRPMPNANARYDPASGLVKLRYGGSTNRVDPAGRWP